MERVIKRWEHNLLAGLFLVFISYIYYQLFISVDRLTNEVAQNNIINTMLVMMFGAIIFGVIEDVVSHIRISDVEMTYIIAPRYNKYMLGWLIFILYYLAILIIPWNGMIIRSGIYGIIIGHGIYLVPKIYSRRTLAFTDQGFYVNNRFYESNQISDIKPGRENMIRMSINGKSQKIKCFNDDCYNKLFEYLFQGYDYELGLSKEDIKGKKIILRETVQCVTVRQGKILMLQNAKGQYLLPGGSLKRQESHDYSLAREIRRKTGYSLYSVNRYCGKITERRVNEHKSKNMDECVSYIYRCQLSEKVGPQELTATEKQMMLKPVWIKPEEAIYKNKECRQTLENEDYWLLKELYVLEQLLGEE